MSRICWSIFIDNTFWDCRCSTSVGRSFPRDTRAYKLLASEFQLLYMGLPSLEIIFLTQWVLRLLLYAAPNLRVETPSSSLIGRNIWLLFVDKQPFGLRPLSALQEENLDRPFFCQSCWAPHDVGLLWLGVLLRRVWLLRTQRPSCRGILRSKSLELSGMPRGWGRVLQPIDLLLHLIWFSNHGGWFCL